MLFLTRLTLCLLINYVLYFISCISHRINLICWKIIMVEWGMHIIGVIFLFWRMGWIWELVGIALLLPLFHPIFIFSDKHRFFTLQTPYFAKKYSIIIFSSGDYYFYHNFYGKYYYFALIVYWYQFLLNWFLVDFLLRFYFFPTFFDTCCYLKMNSDGDVVRGGCGRWGDNFYSLVYWMPKKLCRRKKEQATLWSNCFRVACYLRDKPYII